MLSSGELKFNFNLFSLYFIELNRSSCYNVSLILYRDFTMNGLSVFLNSRVENSGVLAWIGDKGLAPFRYLFNGATICVQPRDSDKEIEIHHVASFHRFGINHASNTGNFLRSSSTGMIQTALSIVFLIPGFIIGAAFKGAAYLFSDIRAKHSLVKLHFTPINRTIGSAENPITTGPQLIRALRDEALNTPKNQRTNALIIHGSEELKITADPGIIQFNPMKLIFVGGFQTVHEASFYRPDDAMYMPGKWQFNRYHVVVEGNSRNMFFKTCNVESVDEALATQAPRIGGFTCKRYHQIFQVPSPQPQTA